MTKNELIINLINQYKISRDSNVLKRIIDLNQGLITWYLKNTNINLNYDELYSLIIIGIENACLSYKEGNPMGHISLGIKTQILRRNDKSNIQNNRLFENFLDVKKIIEKRFGVTLEKDFSIFDDIIDEMELEGMISYHNKDKIKEKIISVLKDYYKSLTLNSSGYDNYPFKFPSDLEEFFDIINATLDKDELYYLSSYYGLFGMDKKTLIEIGDKIKLSRELIRQINERSLMKLKGAIEYHTNELELSIELDDLKELLSKILTKEELKYLSQNLGLFGYFERSLTEISELEGISTDSLWKKINIAKEKIKIALNSYIVLSAFDLNKIRTNLEKLLGQEYFQIVSYTYGIFGYDKLTNREIANKLNINENNVAPKNRKALKMIIDELNTLDKDMIIKFLKSFLTEFEYYVLTSNFGLFNKKKGITELAKEYQASTATIGNCLKIAIGKINTLIIVSESNLDFSKVREFLETLLTKDQFRYLCLNYGLYGNKAISQKEISEREHVSSHVIVNNNIVSVDKIKRYLKGIAN